MSPFEEESVYRLLWKYCIPAMIGMAVQGVTNIITGIFLGRVLGPDALSAVQYAMPFQVITIAFGTLVGVGSAALVSLRLGKKSHQDAEETIGNALILTLTLCSAEIILQLIFLAPLLRLSGAQGAVFDMAWTYTFITVASSIFANLGFGFNNIIRAEGNPRVAMNSVITVALSSVALNWLFIVWLQWGAVGAGLSVAISNLILAVWVIGFFFTKKSLLRFHWNTLRLRKRTVLPILRIGLAPWTMQVSACIQAAVLNYQLSHFGGQDAVAIMGVVIRISLIVFMLITGLSQGAQPIIGYNYGAEQWGRVRQAFGGAIVGSTVISTIGFAIIMLFPHAVMSLFLTDEHQHLLNDGVPALRICLLMMATSGYQIVSVSYFQAIGCPGFSICLTIMRRLGFLTPLLLILPHFWSITGCWSAYAIADGAAAIVIAILIAWEMGRLTVQPKSQELDSEKTLINISEDLY